MKRLNIDLLLFFQAVLCISKEKKITFRSVVLEFTFLLNFARKPAGPELLTVELGVRGEEQEVILNLGTWQIA